MKSSQYRLTGGKDDLYPIANQAVGVTHGDDGVENHDGQTLPSLLWDKCPRLHVPLKVPR